jgi:hypothetical protein
MKLQLTLAVCCTLAAAIGSVSPATVEAQMPDTFTVYASGLNAPRGLTFGSDGWLYVAEGGTGGSVSTAGQCDQVPAPVGPYLGGSTGRISRVSTAGKVLTVASGLPSAVDAGGDFVGVADVTFMNGQLYAVTAAGGCSHGNPSAPNGIYLIDRNAGTFKLVADLGKYLKANPAKFESAGDFEADGEPYSLITVGSKLVTVEANHGQILEVTSAGVIAQILDNSASQGHVVPTSIAQHGSSFYVGTLGLFPVNPQWDRIEVIEQDGSLEQSFAPGFSAGPAYHVVASKAGFSTVVSVKFGPDGLLYALELSDAAGFPAPGNGKVLRVKHSGDIEEVVTQLNVPTGMTFGHDGRLYISDLGAVPAPAVGVGRILRFDIPPGD